MKNIHIKLLPALVAVGLSSPHAFAQSVDLKQLHHLAIQNDPLLSQVALQKEIASESTKATRASLLPQIHAFFNAAYLKDHREVDALRGGSGTSVAVGARFNQALYTPAVTLAVDIAKQDESKAQTLYDKAESALMLRTASTYFDVLRAEENVEVIKANLQALEEVKSQTKQRVELGITSELDLQETQAQFDQASANLILAQAALDTSLDALYTLTGQSFSSVYRLDLNKFTPHVPSPTYGDAWQTAALKNSFDMKLAQESVAISKDQIRLASSGHKPTIVLFGGVNQELLMDIDDVGGLAGTDARLDNLTELDVGISAQLPIYSGGRTTAQVNIAQKGLVLAQSIQEQTYRSVVESIRGSERYANASLQSLFALKKSLASAEATLKAVKQGYQVGTRTMAEVLDANSRYYMAQSRVNNARYNFIEHVLTLKFVAGELTQEDIDGINSGLAVAQKHDRLGN